MKDTFSRIVEERRENGEHQGEQTQDAFVAHLGMMGKLWLRESDKVDNQFMKCVKNKEPGKRTSIQGGWEGWRRRHGNKVKEDQASTTIRGQVQPAKQQQGG